MDNSQELYVPVFQNDGGPLLIGSKVEIAKWGGSDNDDYENISQKIETALLTDHPSLLFLDPVGGVEVAAWCKLKSDNQLYCIFATVCGAEVDFSNLIQNVENQSKEGKFRNLGTLLIPDNILRLQHAADNLSKIEIHEGRAMNGAPSIPNEPVCSYGEAISMPFSKSKATIDIASYDFEDFLGVIVKIS